MTGIGLFSISAATCHSKPNEVAQSLTESPEKVNS
jgi:hypothetical protein